MCEVLWAVWPLICTRYNKLGNYYIHQVEGSRNSTRKHTKEVKVVLKRTTVRQTDGWMAILIPRKVG